MTFRIAQISDTHLSDDKPFFVDNFLRVGEALRADRPDLVLNSGDISLDGASNESDLAAARTLHDGLKLPVRFLPGNHDIGDCQDAPSHGEGTIDPSRRERYQRHFGADRWSFDVPGWRLLGINAQLLGSDLGEAEEQDAAIAEAAATAGTRRIALFLHKPMFDRSVDESEITGRFINPGPRRALLEALGHTTPSLVACGHVHQYRETWSEGVRHVWAPSTAFVLPDRRQPRYGLKQVGYVESIGSRRTADMQAVSYACPACPTSTLTTSPKRMRSCTNDAEVNRVADQSEEGGLRACVTLVLPLDCLVACSLEQAWRHWLLHRSSGRRTLSLCEQPGRLTPHSSSWLRAMRATPRTS